MEGAGADRLQLSDPQRFVQPCEAVRGDPVVRENDAIEFRTVRPRGDNVRVALEGDAGRREGVPMSIDTLPDVFRDSDVRQGVAGGSSKP